jgi:type VI secretion system protein ImpL
MKRTLLKSLKIFLIAVGICVAVLLIFGAVLGLGWPWWAGLFVLIGLFGLFLGLIFLKKVLLRRREQFFIHQVIDQDDSYAKGLEDKEKTRSRELQDRWKEAMTALRNSHLKKFGNPLYVLPWYLVIGESGSGKSTAIKSARLSSPFAEVIRTPGLSGTKNCDWWFFEQAVVIDTAGRYAIPVDEGHDKEEWQKFLGHLVRFRQKEPINGLVVTVAADKLLEQGREDLEKDGKSIRQRVDELMRVLGAKFPVYVLVTKCDLIQGMSQFADHLPEAVHDQAMGVINPDLSKDLVVFIDRAIQTVGERLRDLRLLLFHGNRAKGIDPEFLLFPEEFERLRPGLTAFVKGAFLENPYQETPILRGVYYSSGRQEGTPYSHFLKALGLIGEKAVLPGTDRGLFLHDLFSRILPKDRGLFAPTQRKMTWSRLTRNLGLTSWVALVLALCGILSFSFVNNLKILRDVSRDFSKPIALQGTPLTDVGNMDRFRTAILEVEDQNRKWWIPRFGLNESKRVETGLKAGYCTQFGSGFLLPLDKRMTEEITRFSVDTPVAAVIPFLDHMVKRINLLRARLDGANMDALESRPQPSYETVSWDSHEKIIPEIRRRYADLYLYYLVWQKDSSKLNEEIIQLQSYLKHVITSKQNDLRWLVDWVNASPSLSPVRLGDFWGESETQSNEISIPPAFTVQGKAQIDAFLKEIEAALADPLLIVNQKTSFQDWYRPAYLNAWYTFGTHFPKGVEVASDLEEQRRLAATMGTQKDPYLRLLDRMVLELEPFGFDKEGPFWVKLVYSLKAARLEAARSPDSAEAGTLMKIGEKGKKLLVGLEKRMGGDHEISLEATIIAGEWLREYQKALSEISPAVESRKIAFNVASKVFSEDPVTGDSPFRKAKFAREKIRSSLGTAGPDEKMIWDLVGGPFEFLWTYVCGETSCALQDLWEKTVLVEVQGLSNEKDLGRLLLGDEGYAAKFIKGPAGPFVNRSLKKGYHANEALGRSIPFKNAFLSFFTKGATAVRFDPEPPPTDTKPVKSEYIVSIKALPTDVNKEARILPHATRLELQCGRESSRLVNLHYPVEKVFQWSAQTCGDVVFKIEVASLVLTKVYSGELAFPRFLKDFEGGNRTFRTADFPAEEEALKRLGIDYIKANYEFGGHEPVLELLRPTPKSPQVQKIPTLPESIVSCWDR